MPVELRRIDGSSLQFLAAGEIDRPTSIIVLLHGVGGDAEYLLPVADRVSQRLPGTLCIVPNAPLLMVEEVTAAQRARADQLKPGLDWTRRRTWVSLRSESTLNPKEVIEAMDASILAPARAVNRLADLHLARFGLRPMRLVFYGFSQGGMLAIRAGLARASECAGVVSHSGHFLSAIEVLSRPRMLLMAGEHELRAGQAMAAVFPKSVELLRGEGVAVQEYVVPAIGHKIDDTAVARTVAFAEEVLAGPSDDGLTSQ